MKPVILIVEDDCEAVDKLCRSLNIQYDFIRAKTLDEALKIVKTQTPDVILLDLYLPDCSDGLTFQRMHEASPLTPIVICVSHEDELREAKRLSESLVISKDKFDLNRINEIILHAVVAYKIKAIYMPLDQAVIKVGKIVQNLTDSQARLNTERENLIAQARK